MSASLGEKRPQLPPALTGVVRRRVWLELRPSLERADNDWIESGIARQCRRGFECCGIITGKWNADTISFSMRLGFQGLEVDRVEGLHPPAASKHRGRPTRRTPRVPRGLRRQITVPPLIGIRCVEHDFAIECRRKIAREIG